MHIDRFVEMMEGVAPPELAEDFDCGRIGVIIEGRPDVKAVCCALDVTPGVVERAIANGADTLVVHHTPLWHPVTALTGAAASLLRPVLAAGITVYVMHSNFDHAEGGVNDTLARILDLGDTARMSLGVVGDCPLSIAEIARRLGCSLRVYGEAEMPGRLAVVGGSGFDPCLIGEAGALGAEAFLSAELKHSTQLASPLPLIEATHYALEAPGMRALAERMGWTFIEDPPAVITVE
jgi:dinuclear metal center YbgI/SA1388 family protein